MIPMEKNNFPKGNIAHPIVFSEYPVRIIIPMREKYFYMNLFRTGSISVRKFQINCSLRENIFLLEFIF